MKIKFNKYERIAGLFVAAAIVGSVAATVGVAIKKGWFSSKIEYYTIFKSAEGLHSGTLVQIAGLRAGQVVEVELLSANEVRVDFEIFKKFQPRVREDSTIQIYRPFIIGEKVLDISVGGENKGMLAKGKQLQAKEAFDMMDLVSGRRLAPFLGSLEGLMDNMKALAEAFSDPERTKAFIKMFDRMDPMIRNLNTMSKEVVKVTKIATKQKRLDILMQNLAEMTTEFNTMLPQLSENAPGMAEQIPILVSNLTELTTQFKKLTPAIEIIAPELPDASKRALEALDEMVIVLKAIQKSFLLSGKVDDVREEEAKRKRNPAGK